MNRKHFFLLGFCFLLLAAAGANYLSDPFNACATGQIRGFGFDKETGKYKGTCGNYNWSAEVGGVDANGVSKIGSPTTVGGNSWTLLCSGDGTARNGTAAEASICLTASERPKMYSMADIMLAHDFTRAGGAVYLPEGIYHDRYCGKSALGVANGCPVLSRSPGHQTRKIHFSRGISLEMEGKDPDGPHVNGRTSTWLISDHGGDTDNNNLISDNVSDPGGFAGYLPSHWAFRVGLGGAVNTDRICVKQAGINGCVTTNATVRDQDIEPLNLFSRSSGLVLATMSNQGGTPPTICLENRTTAGVCNNDPTIQCTTDSACASVGGGCVGPATALETALEARADSSLHGSNAANGLYVIINTFSQGAFGTDDVANNTSAGVLAAISNVESTTCASGNGRLVALGDIQDARNFYRTNNLKFDFSMWNPMLNPVYDAAVQSLRVFVVSHEILFNHGGGFKGGNFMPGSWKDRRSLTTTASCTNNWTGTYEAACDDVDMFALGGGVGGGIYDSAAWYGGGQGGFAFSKVDGDVNGFGTEAKRNWFVRGYGLQTDASGWTFEDNIWQDINGISQGGTLIGSNIIYAGFAPGFRMFRDRFINISGQDFISFQQSTGAVVRDITIEGGQFVSLLNLRGARRSLIDGVTGHGVRVGGSLIQVNPQGAADVFDDVITNVAIDNVEENFTTNGGAKSMVWVSDSNTGSGSISGPIRIENISMAVHGDSSFCGVFLDGGTGADDTAINGNGRAIDDGRHFLQLKNLNLERISDGSVAGTLQPFCLSKEVSVTSAGNGPEDTLLGINSAVGGVPRWENLYMNGVMYPDNPTSSQTAASTGDCGSLLPGTVVLIHDATVAGACTDTGADGTLDGGGTNLIRCSCVPTGTGAWDVAD